MSFFLRKGLPHFFVELLDILFKCVIKVTPPFFFKVAEYSWMVGFFRVVHHCCLHPVHQESRGRVPVDLGGIGCLRGHESRGVGRCHILGDFCLYPRLWRYVYAAECSKPCIEGITVFCCIMY